MTDPPKMTVVHSVSRWLPQTATWLHSQVRFLTPDIENHIVCETTLNLDQFSVPNIHAIDTLPTWRYVWDKGVRRLGLRAHLAFLATTARDVGASLIHSHFGYTAWRDRGAARAAGVKHVVTFYGLDVNFYPKSDPKWGHRYHELFDSVDRVLCEGPHMGRCIAALGCPEEKISVHHLGIDISQIPFAPRKWRPGEPLRVFMAGSFREKKGFPYAIEALGAIKDEVELEITLIGDEHGEERTKVEKRKILDAVAAHGLESRTRLLGYQPYSVVLEEAGRHHVFLSPSVTAADGDTEGGAPVTIIEMAASGMVIVSTTHCDIPGVIEDGATGLLAPERDVDGLAAKLRWLIAHPDDWSRFQHAGRAHIEAEFDARVQGRRLADVYRDVSQR